MTPPMDYCQPLITGTKQIKIQELLNQKLETIVLTILRELQESINKQFSDIRKTIEKTK